MSILTGLFGESPFAALEGHGEKVHQSLGLLREMFQVLERGDAERLRSLCERVVALESEADQIRNQLHEFLAARVLLPIGKQDLFNILEHQDSMADRAEDVAYTLTFREMPLPRELMAEVQGYLELVLRNCELAAGIMSRMDLLVESSFTGRDALTVSRLITELAERDDAVKPAQVELTRKLLAAGDQIPPVEAMLWLRVIGELSEMSKHADRTGQAVRLTLRIRQTKKGA